MAKKVINSYAPGRINIIGEHTDYNQGFVLPAAIDKGITFKLERNNNIHQVNIFAKDIDEKFTFHLDSFNREKSGWQNYTLGVVDEIQKLKGPLVGFDAEFFGDLPIGAGLSSSAALECSIAFGLNELFNLNLDDWQLIKLTQRAEHNFVGTKCGLMDQFASIKAKANKAMLLDCRSLDFEYVPIDLENFQFFLLNTNVSHNLADSEYNKRREECQAAVELLSRNAENTKSLRDINYHSLLKFEYEIPEKLFKRSRHVLTENRRVQFALKAIKNKDYDSLGNLMFQSHESLQKDYEVSCPELDFLVDLAKESEHVLGSRMMGGGFGGCTINLIQKKHVDQFVNFCDVRYKKKFGAILSPYFIKIEEGAKLISSD